MLVCFQAKVHSCRFEILHRYCHSVWEYCKMNHLIFGLMQISSPGYYLTWIFPSGKNCHAVEIPGFKCDSLQLSKWNDWGKMELTFFFQGCVCAVDVICNWWHDDLYKGTNRKRKCFCFSCLPHEQAEDSTLYPNQTHPWPQNRV